MQFVEKWCFTYHSSDDVFSPGHLQIIFVVYNDFGSVLVASFGMPILIRNHHLIGAYFVVMRLSFPSLRVEYMVNLLVLV